MYIYIYTYVDMYIYIYTYVDMYIYIYICNVKSGLINTIILMNALPSPKICQYYFPLGPKRPSQ